MLSHKYKCIFIHIPKTAGTSIEYQLGHFKKVRGGVQDHRTIMEIEPLSYADLMKSIREHGKTFAIREAKNLIRRGGRIPAQYYNSYFKFTFVRNPWARVYSWYRNVMRDSIHKQKLAVSDNCTFEEFVEIHLNHWELKSQLSWIRDRSGEIPLDFIGRFESLEDDFSGVCDVLGIEDKRLPKLISGNNPHYAQFYDEGMRNAVARKYAEEIEFFNFEFSQ